MTGPSAAGRVNVCKVRGAGLFGMWEKEQAEAAQHGIERGLGEIEPLGIHLPERDVGQAAPLDFRRRLRHHLRREVNPHHVPLWPDLRGQWEQDRAAAGGHVEGGCARPDLGESGQPPAKLRQVTEVAVSVRDPIKDLSD